jgi:peroxiredoxin
MAGRRLQEIVQALEGARTHSGETLSALSETSPVLLVFLRHAGCPFCREALGDVSRARRAIEAAGARVILVHMGDSQAIDDLLRRYGLAALDRICDCERRLYAAFGLRRATLGQLFGPKVLWRAFQAGVLSRHGMGRISADSSQLPGLFLIHKSAIVRRFRHRTAADRPDYQAIGAAPAESGCSS